MAKELLLIIFDLLQPFMGAPRYPSGPRGPGGVRMPQGMGSEFNGVSGGMGSGFRELVANCACLASYL